MVSVCYNRNHALRITVEPSFVVEIREAWQALMALSDQMPSEHRISLSGSIEDAIETSVDWLIQHEINHFAIGHFHLLETQQIAETSPTRSFDLLQRASNVPPLLDGFTEEERRLAPLCLELQTDHDATEFILGAYGGDAHEVLRERAIAIVVVMFLIERHEQDCAQRTHPLPSTRLFMLLAHLVEMPVLPATFRAVQEGLTELPADRLPDPDEMEAYREKVVSKIFVTSQLIAEAIDLPKLWDQVGGADVFFEDINRILIDNATEEDAFSTEGAKEWARLKPLNDRLLKILAGLREKHPELSDTSGLTVTINDDVVDT